MTSTMASTRAQKLAASLPNRDTVSNASQRMHHLVDRAADTSSNWAESLRDNAMSAANQFDDNSSRFIKMEKEMIRNSISKATSRPLLTAGLIVLAG